MGENSNISWLHRRLPDGHIIMGNTYNPWWGCVKIAPGCKNCYAEGFAKRVGEKVWGPASTTPRRLFGEQHWQAPLKWNKKAEKSGHRASVFCASMADVFEDHPQLPPEREKLWDLIGKTRWLNWLLLTKRPENILKMAPWEASPECWPDTVWIGTSVSTQEDADTNIPQLLQVPACVRFVSYEPALEWVNFMPYMHGLDWLICGGESGPSARPFDLAWARSVRDQCLVSRYPVAFHFKQVGGRTHSAGGRLLDGREWNDMPPEFPKLPE